MKDQAPASAEVEKWKAYFENKQPANRASTKVLEKFFKARGEDAPPDEVKAWERMAELIEEEKKPEPEAAADPTPPTPTVPTVEAPRKEEAPPERSIPLTSLKELPAAFMQEAIRAAEESLLRGEPVKNLPKVVEAVGKKFFQSLSTH